MKRETKNLSDLIAILNGESREKLELFRKMLLKYNQKYNLTAITEEKEVFYKHFLDSVAGESLFPQNSNVVEVGSGAGFPSIPLKIIRDDLHFTLIESTGKKCDFLRAVVDNLSLSCVQVLNMRAEDAGRDSSLREKFDLSTARAVAKLNTLAEYCLPLVKVGGSFVAYKGTAEELSSAERAISLLGGKLDQVVDYSLPEGYGERTIVVVDKISSTPNKYPRGNGKERSKPL